MRIGIDLDGVIADFPNNFIEVAKVFGYQAKADALNMGLPRQRFLAIYNHMIHNGYFDTMKPYPGAVETLKEWKRQGHEIFYITRRRPAYPDDKAERLHQLQTKTWLMRCHFPPGVVEFTQDKLAYCLANEITVLIEDYLGDCLKWLGKGVKVYLVDRPWNQGDYPWRVKNLQGVKLEG